MCEKIKQLKYDIHTVVISKPQEFPRDPYSNGFIVINSGAGGSIVLLNGAAIPANGSMTIGGNLGEVFRGRLQISFAGGGAPECTIIEKFYTDPENDLSK